MDGLLEGRVILRVSKDDQGKLGPLALPHGEFLSVGRTTGYGVHIAEPWVPTKLCRFIDFPLGWVVQVGPRARMLVKGKDSEKQIFTRGSLAALQEGTTYLTFPELDDFVEVLVQIGPDAAEGATVVHDAEEFARETRTEYAVTHVSLTEHQRVVLAAAFDHLRTGGPKPDNLVTAAVERCGATAPTVKKILSKTLDKVNKERWNKLETYEQLGYYLVHQTRTNLFTTA